MFARNRSHAPSFPETIVIWLSPCTPIWNNKQRLRRLARDEIQDGGAPSARALQLIAPPPPTSLLSIVGRDLARPFFLTSLQLRFPPNDEWCGRTSSLHKILSQYTSSGTVGVWWFSSEISFFFSLSFTLFFCKISLNFAPVSASWV